MRVCCVWSVVCFNFVATQKNSGFEEELKDLQEKTKDFGRMEQV